MNRQIDELVDVAIKAALAAGDEILEVYNSEFAVEHKDDKSPLTEADKRAHLKIVSFLQATDLPILSEEGRDIPYEERKNWEQFWMVDPLDGTKEFVKRNGEFTVNIALIAGNYPIAGVIYVPVHRQLFVGVNGKGAYFLENPNPDINLKELAEIGKSIPESLDRKFAVVGSRSHMSPETESFINEQKQKHGEVDIVSMGSSLKICMVARGRADMYPRFAPTMEWDTAAGQGIAEAAGKSVINWETKERMSYNKENLLNSWFLVS